MKAIITGMNGTVAPASAEKLIKEGWEITVWDRSKIKIDDTDAIRKFIQVEKPDWILHFATGPVEWAAALSQISYELNLNFFFASSVSVYSGNQHKPITKEMQPDATDDYGKYKRECEERIFNNNRKSIIARLGWQIGNSPGSNNMIDYLFKKEKEETIIKASVNWYPSCSFLDDTADAIFKLMMQNEPGIYHLNGNKNLSFYEIAVNLNSLFKFNWKIEPVTEPIYDNRMSDNKAFVKDIIERFQFQL